MTFTWLMGKVDISMGHMDVHGSRPPLESYLVSEVSEHDMDAESPRTGTRENATNMQGTRDTRLQPRLQG